MLDEKTNMLWLYTNANTTGVGHISGIMVVVPTSYGVIQVQGYSSEKSFTSFLPDFTRAIDSFHLDPSAKY